MEEICGDLSYTACCKYTFIYSLLPIVKVGSMGHIWQPAKPVVKY